GVLPLVAAEGAGAEMRRALGTAVFSGMLGVTLFGVFLTPVFFYVIEGPAARWILSLRWLTFLVELLSRTPKPRERNDGIQLPVVSASSAKITESR
ncbi:MAG: efflux RND transporter permease subunit, partial [Phycisphaerae bacterium]